MMFDSDEDYSSKPGADVRILGLLLAAQNMMFVLPDEIRIEEFFSQALGEVPGVESCFVCLEAPPRSARTEVCRECLKQRKDAESFYPRPFGFICALSSEPETEVIPLRAMSENFGFLVIRVGSEQKLKPYLPFIKNLSNFIALSLENRIQKNLLERSRSELEEEVKKRTGELSIANERFSLAAQAAKIGVWDWDIENDRLIWDDGMLKLYGIRRDQFIGAYKTWLQAIHPDDREENCRISIMARNGQCDYETEFRVIHPDGSIHHLKAYADILRNEQGKPIRMTGVNFDITERKVAEESLKKLNETLEQRVVAEVRKNREKDHILIHQSRMAAMGEMVQSIAHQWRQPLNNVSLILSNIEDEFDYGELTKDSLQKRTHQIYDLLQQMSGTIDDFRNFFEPDRNPEIFDTGECVKKAFALVETGLRAHSIQCNLTVEPGLNAFGFANQYSQVVLNILTNAEEAIRRSGVDGKIQIDLRRNEDRSILSVQDNGGGIPVAILDRIFDPYFTTKRRGSGIGLYMSRMIIERNLQGNIIAENRGAGTLISVSLPLAS